MARATAGRGRTEQAAAAGADGVVPERPALASNVTLSGALAGHASARGRWLVERGGRFVQLTERLYRIAERADGRHTLAELAAAVSERTDRRLGPEQVRRLIETKLIPLGLIVRADGTVARAAVARSAFAVQARLLRLGPERIEPVARALRCLYRPPVVAAVLLAAAGAEAWLYVAHGVAQAVRHVLSTPGLILLLFGVLLLSTICHEFGHAAALAYGGGRVRGMGAGFYLIYPAFYTDVTDNYRLGRWARLRTDLGGCYFNLVFSLLAMGVYALTRAEFLVLVVLFVNLDLARQLLPFVRLDGYWALADLTGLPDFFARLGPFSRALLPVPAWRGERRDDLRGWVRAVLLGYLLLVVPLMGVLLLLGLRNLPRVLATSWAAPLRQLAIGAHALAAGDALALAAVALQTVALALPAVGLGVSLVTVGRRVLRGLWAWSAGSGGRRALAAGGVAVALAALCQFTPACAPAVCGQRTPRTRVALGRDSVPCSSRCALVWPAGRDLPAGRRHPVRVVGTAAPPSRRGGPGGSSCP